MILKIIIVKVDPVPHGAFLTDVDHYPLDVMLEHSQYLTILRAQSIKVRVDLKGSDHRTEFHT